MADDADHRTVTPNGRATRPQRRDGRSLALRLSAGLGAAALLGGLTWVLLADLVPRGSETGVDAAPPALRTALHQAISAEESYAVEHNGEYTASLEELFRYEEAPSADVELVIVRADEHEGGERGYCLSARHVDGGPVLWFSTETNEISDAPCD